MVIKLSTLDSQHFWVHLGFNKLILFDKVLSELSEIFERLKKFEVIFEIWAIKVGDLNRFQWKGQTKKTKKKHFTNNISPPLLSEQSFTILHRKSIIKF